MCVSIKFLSILSSVSDILPVLRNPFEKKKRKKESCLDFSFHSHTELFGTIHSDLVFKIVLNDIYSCNYFIGCKRKWIEMN